MLDLLMEDSKVVQINLLQEENKKLREELEFYKTISNFGNSLVGNMCVKFKDGIKIWIDRQKVTKETLDQLEKDEDILEWLDTIQTIRYKDNDW
tara:strand:+ start:1406 stop:1687 length:282 start_codon:yes stop_codon:yes gene_type:complete